MRNPANMWCVTQHDQSPTEGRFQSPQIRRRQILDAAARLAVDSGLDSATMASIASEAGLAKGSIYLQFESRQALLSALQADLWARMLERPEAIIADPELTSPAKLDAVVDHLMRFEFEHHDLYHAVFHTVASDSDEPFAQAAELLRELLHAGVLAGDFDLDGLDPDIVLHFLLHGYVGPCFHHNDQDAAIRNVQQLFRRALNAPHST